MPRSGKLSALTVALLLAASVAMATPRREAAPPRRSTAAPEEISLSRLWEWLAAAWAKAGCGSDPGGNCQSSGTSAAPAEAGCGLDPGGLCGGSR